MTNDRNRKLPLRTKFAFASGSVEEATISAAAITTFLYYNQVLGVSAALCGTAFLVASVIDAISDPLVGALSDRARTRWGRRHPFMLGAALPLAGSFYLLYQPPSGLTEFQLFFWMTSATVGLRIAKTFYAIPHSALGAELTDDYDERTSIFAYNWLVHQVAVITLGVGVLVLLFPTTEGFSNGLLNPDGYPRLAAGGAVLIFFAIVFCAWSTRDQIPYLHAQASARPSTRQYFEDLIALMRNPSYVAVFFCWLVLALSQGIVFNLTTYAFVYGFEFSTEQITLNRIVTIPGVILAVAISAWLTRRFDKKPTVIGTIAFAIALQGLPFTLRLLGVFPENGSAWLLPAYFGIWAVANLALPVIPIVIDSQLSDIADEHELRTGRRAEGLIFSVRTFGMKLSQGLGGQFAGFGLEIIGFPENADFEFLEPEVIDGMMFMLGPVYYGLCLSGLLFAFVYRISRSRHAEIMRELNARRNTQS